MMKQRILAFLLAGMFLLLSACHATSPIVGTWVLTEKKVDGVEVDFSDTSVIYTFAKNKTFTMTVNEVEAATGTYTFENNVLTWTVNELSGQMTLEDAFLISYATVDEKPIRSIYEKAES